MTRARRRVAAAPTPRHPAARPRHGAIVDFTFTRERPVRIGLRTTRIRIVDDAHATKTAIARSPRPRVGRRARVGRATRSRRHFTHRRSQWCARCDATRRDATRRAREDEDDRGRARETARGAPRRGSGRDDAGRGCRVIRRGRSSATIGTRDGVARDAVGVAMRANDGEKIRASSDAASRANAGARTRGRARDGASGTPPRGHRDRARRRRPTPRERKTARGRRDADARRDERGSSRALGASNGRAAWATTRGRRRSRARGVDKPPARASRGSGLGRDSSSATNSVESTARSAETDRTRARVFRVVYSRSLASPLPRSPPRRSKPSPVASRAKPPPRRLARRPSRR